MTKSTGVRERQRQREELLAAELKLSSVLRHLLDGINWAKRNKDKRDRKAREGAYDVVWVRLVQVGKEQRELKR